MIVKENPLRNIQEDAKKYVSAVLKDFIWTVITNVSDYQQVVLKLTKTDNVLHA